MSDTSGQVKIHSESDIIQARQQARKAAETTGFGTTDITRIVTAVSELARNIYLYAGEGSMEWRHVEEDDKSGLRVVFDDDGPGITDPEAALEGNFSTSDGMGQGLSGTRTLMDAMDLETERGEGTTITIIKWNS